MRLQVKVAIFFVMTLFFSHAHADAFVCIDKQGKKVFVNESCEKKGMKAGTHDFPVVSGQSINAVIIEAQSAENIENNLKIAHSKVKKGTWDFRAGTFKMSPVILIFLLFSLTGIAFILIYQVVVYFKNHQRKLIWSNEVECIAPHKN